MWSALPYTQEELGEYRASLSAESEPPDLSSSAAEEPRALAGHASAGANAKPLELVIANKVDACAQPQQVCMVQLGQTVLLIFLAQTWEMRLSFMMLDVVVGPCLPHEAMNSHSILLER